MAPPFVDAAGNLIEAVEVTHYLNYNIDAGTNKGLKSASTRVREITGGFFIKGFHHEDWIEPPLSINNNGCTAEDLKTVDHFLSA